ncbi:hypothetical protein LIER_01459 [Lithospermum erythrorhizon]|uniref:Uncharacterized protein n=1 Tax=Lithospermum erythrorhizon TaxID=34254 RepID=A0AAV3NND1_LITER
MQFFAMVDRQFEAKVEIVRSDNVFYENEFPYASSSTIVPSTTSSPMPITIDYASEYTESESDDGDVEAIEVVDEDDRVSFEPRVKLPALAPIPELHQPTPGLTADSVGQQGDPDLQGSAGAAEDGRLVVSDEFVELGRGRRVKTLYVRLQDKIGHINFLADITACIESNSYKEAVQHAEWRKAM